MNEKENQAALRKVIDDIDKLLVNLLEKRFDAVSLIGESKKAQGIAVLDKEREDKIMKKLEESRYPNNVKEVYKTIFDESKKIES